MSRINILILLALLVPAISKYTGFSYLDELITLVLGIAFAMRLVTKGYRISKVEKNILLCMIVFYVLGLLSSLTFKYQPIYISALSGIFSIKAFITYFGMRVICDEYSHSRKSKIRLLKILKCLLVISAFLLVIDMIWPLFEQLGKRFGIITTTFIFESHTELCCYGIILVMMIIFLKRDLGYKTSNIIWVIMSFIIVMRGGRVKAVGFLALFIALYVLLPFIRKFKIQYVLIALPLVWLVADEQIIYYFGNLSSARGRLYYNGFNIAKDFFPLGSGFATFGTEFSRRYYSIIYDMYNLSNVYGFSRMYPYFIADTMWPAIMGEAGFLGAIVYMIGFVQMYFMVLKGQFDKYMKMLLFSILTYGLFESIGDSIFMSSRGVLILICFAYMYTQCNKKLQVYNNEFV